MRFIAFALHTAQIFQVPDVTLVGILKRRARCKLPFGDDRATGERRMKVYHGFKQTMVESNIRGVFQALEFEFDITSEP
jgi:hypothetical protein